MFELEPADNERIFNKFTAKIFTIKEDIATGFTISQICEVIIFLEN